MDSVRGGVYTVTVWAVVYGNYFPQKVLWLYTNEQAACDHVEAEALDDSLEVVPMVVYAKYEP